MRFSTTVVVAFIAYTNQALAAPVPANNQSLEARSSHHGGGYHSYRQQSQDIEARAPHTHQHRRHKPTPPSVEKATVTTETNTSKGDLQEIEAREPLRDHHGGHHHGGGHRHGGGRHSHSQSQDPSTEPQQDPSATTETPPSKRDLQEIEAREPRRDHHGRGHHHGGGHRHGGGRHSHSQSQDPSAEPQPDPSASQEKRDLEAIEARSLEIEELD